MEVATCEPTDLADVPSRQGYSTYFVTVIDGVEHPALSANGFTNDGAVGVGLGMKEIIEGVFAEPEQDEIVFVYRTLLEWAYSNDPGAPYYGGYEPAPTSWAEVRRNAAILQARAFFALASYLLQQNGCSDFAGLHDELGVSGLPATHEDALGLLLVPLRDEHGWDVDESYGNEATDAVKWATALMSMARAVDLYLGLDVAYRHYSDPDAGTDLLSELELRTVLRSLHENIGETDKIAREIFNIVDVSSFEPGNRPLKILVAMGYASMAIQNYEQNYTDGLTLINIHNDSFEEALYTAGAQGSSRSKKWSYQTSNGKRFWAEGPYYFHYALSQVVSFWHAVRINGLLDYGSYDIDDPFRSGWFTTPLHWLADTATPGGRLLPLEDGHKSVMYNAYPLRWTSGYGDRDLGEKFAWILDKQPTSFGGYEQLLPIELAIPRLGAGHGDAPERTVPGGVGTTSEQQVILRRDGRDEACTDGGAGWDGACHFVVLNGEHGDAIGRGEGHEQPDQLQLLYYVNDVSYLSDTGYGDFPGFILPEGYGRSEFNNYEDHNVVHSYGTGFADVAYPELKLFADGRVNSNHQDAEQLRYERHGRLDEASARLPLWKDRDDDSHYATYRRRLLFVDDPDAPYLIDVNMLSATDMGLGGEGYPFVLSYHANSDRLVRDQSDDAYNLWEDMWTGSGGGRCSDCHLFLYAGRVEGEPPTGVELARGASARVEEYLGNGRNIERLDLGSWGFDMLEGRFSAGYAHGQTFVAFIQTTDEVQHTPPEPIVTAEPLPGDYNPWQAWAWQVDDATVDVVAARSGNVYSVLNGPRPAATFTIEEADGLALRLPSARDYGFARLRLDNGEWVIDGDYLLGLELSTPTNITADHTISSNETWSGPVTIADGVTVTVTASGHLTIAPGTTVTLGAGARIYADGVMTVGAAGGATVTIQGDGGGRWETVWIRDSAANGSAFHNVTLTGSEYGISTTNLDDITFDELYTYGNGFSSLRLISSDATIRGGSVLRDNDTHGLYADGGTVTVLDSRFENNGHSGLVLKGVAAADFGRPGQNAPSVISGNSYGLYIYEDADVVLGDYGCDRSGPFGSSTVENNATANAFVYNQYGHLKADGTWWGSSQAADVYAGLDPDPSKPGTYAISLLNGGGDDWLCDPSPRPATCGAWAGQGCGSASALAAAAPPPTAMAEPLRLASAPADNGSARATFARQYRSKRKSSKGLARSFLQGHRQHADPGVARLAAILFVEHVLRERDAAAGLAVGEDLLESVELLDWERAFAAKRLFFAYLDHGDRGRARQALELLTGLGDEDARSGFLRTLLEGTSEAVGSEVASTNEGSRALEAASPSTPLLDVKATEGAEVPAAFALAAYPNPFNPSTEVAYALPESAEVSLVVYDVMGRAVAQLVGGPMPAGQHRARFDGSGLASGTYVVRLQAGAHVATQTVVLLR